MIPSDIMQFISPKRLAVQITPKLSSQMTHFSSAKESTLARQRKTKPARRGKLKKKKKRKEETIHRTENTLPFASILVRARA